MTATPVKRRPLLSEVKVISPTVTTPVGPDELTIAQAATRLGLTKTAVLKSIYRGVIPAVRRGYPGDPTPMYFVTVADVDASTTRLRVAGRVGKPGPRTKRKKATWSRVRKTPTPRQSVEEIVAAATAAGHEARA
jgi:hypothetical protein